MSKPRLRPLRILPGLAVAVTGAVLDGFHHRLLGSVMLFCGIVANVVVANMRDKSN